MLANPAQYLLRFDDLCPTVSPERWLRCRELIQEFQIEPILAVVPDNQDPVLQVARPDAGFWNVLRAMESAGAIIGLHGYRHLCTSRGLSLVPLHSESEFAGVAAATQREWIHDGLRILREQQLNPKLWVAPRHGFDRNTLSALREEGIEVLSDGFARVPFKRGGVIWIPQQLWTPVHKTKGLWTLCVHPNTVTDAQLAELRVFLRNHGDQFTSVDRVLNEFHSTAPGPAEDFAEKCYSKLALRRILTSRITTRLRNRQLKLD